MATTRVFYWQKESTDPWQAALSEERPKIVSVEKPAFVTVLDVSAVVTDEMTQEELSALRYWGPAYVDWDAKDIEESISAFKRFLGKLADQGVDLKSIRLYATGNRGFHAELPMGLFMAKIPPKGVPYLPAIYKEIAYQMYVDTMDLRVYSAKRGRMWRTPGIRRENGKYKVPITVDEAFAMTAESYAQLCSAPRQPFDLAPASFSSKLALAYATAENKVAAAAKRRKESSKDVELLTKFGGAYPPTLLKVMNGVGIEDGVGFHSIAMQVAITSNALGKSEDEMLALCEGLCESHKSDGTRYNTVEKRRDELVRMHRYTSGNPCYTYGVGAIKSLLAQGQVAADLDGLSAEAGTPIDTTIADNTLLVGVFMTESGIYVRTDNGVKNLSNMSFKDVAQVWDCESNRAQGYEASMVVNGRVVGQRHLKPESFLSRQQFLKLCYDVSASSQAADQHVSAVHAILGDIAVKEKNILYSVSREGLNLLNRPGATDGSMDRMWVSPDGVMTFGKTPINYVFRGRYMTDGAMKTDVLNAPDLVCDDYSADVLRALFTMNTDFVMATLLGWMVSTFQNAFYHQYWNQFPLCQVFGQAGAGKTATVYALLRLFYAYRRPQILQCDSKPYGLVTTVQSSASIPVVFDEYKPREFRQEKKDALNLLFRAAYNAGTLRKGGGTGEISSSWREVSEEAITGPILFIGEALESQTAILERCVVAPLSRMGLFGREEQHKLVQEGGLVLSSIGRKLAETTILNFNPDSFRANFDVNLAAVKKVAFRRNNHRVVYNMAVILNGLDYLEELINREQGFNGKFDKQFAKAKAAILNLDNQVAVTVMPEAAKVLSTLAFISQTEEPGTELAVQEGVDYIYPMDSALEIKVRNCFVKYVAWCRRKGQPPLYDTEDACMHGLAHYGAILDKVCTDSQLKESAQVPVYRFNVKHLEEEGVEPFRRR